MPTDEQPPPAVEVEFTIDNDRYPFIFASEAEDCRVELAEMIPRQGDRYAEFFHVTGADAAEIADTAAAYDTVDIRVLREYESGTLLEFTVTGNCPAYDLARRGGLPREVVGENGEGRVVVEIPSYHQPADTIEAFLAAYPEASMVAKREKEQIRPMFAVSEFQEVVQKHLTGRQREVLRAAFDAGYYDWPRTATGEEVADDLDIASATFSEHIQTAERKLLQALFAEPRMS